MIKYARNTCSKGALGALEPRINVLPDFTDFGIWGDTRRDGV